MKAVLMAGGEGTRLRPLTCDIPKPMARLCGRPIMEYIIELLSEHNVRSTVVTLRYLPHIIKNHFSSGSFAGVDLEFIEENTPLGTAGSVKNAAKGFEDDFIVISGDALCDFSLTEAMKFHKKNNATATIVVTHIDDPREYGLVRTDGSSRISGFVEKPCFAQAVTDLANTGIYILSPEVLKLIPDNEKHDFAKDVFPAMLEQNIPIYTYEADGYWCDIGDINSYISSQMDMLNGRVKCRIDAKEIAKGVFCKGDMPDSDIRIVPPVYIGAETEIMNGCILNSTVVDDGVFIGYNSKIKKSVVLPHAYLGDNVSLTGSICCVGSSVKERASLFEGSAIGGSAVIGRDSTVCPGVKIWNTKIVEDGAVVRDNLQYGTARNDYFSDDGISGETGVEINPEICARIGSAVGSINKFNRFAVACSDDKSAYALKSALIAGILSTGCGVWDMGSCHKPLFSFGMTICGLPLGVYIEGGLNTNIKFLVEGGLPAQREIEREISQLLSRGEFKRCRYDSYEKTIDFTGAKLLYDLELRKQLKYNLDDYPVTVRGYSQAKNNLSEILVKNGCILKDGPIFNLSDYGSRLSIFDNSVGLLTGDKILSICCLIEFENGNDVAIPADSPRAIDTLANEYGRKALRYFDCPADSSDKEVRNIAKEQLFVRDGLMQAVKIINHMKKTGKSLQELASLIPQFVVEMRSVAINMNPGKLIGQLSGSDDKKGISEGVLLTREQGYVLVRPQKRGDYIKLFAEASSFEAAKELCDGLEKYINSIGRDSKE